MDLWSPHGVHVESMGTPLALSKTGPPFWESPRGLHMDSTNPRGLRVDSKRTLWGRVKSSGNLRYNYCVCRAVCERPRHGSRMTVQNR